MGTEKVNEDVRRGQKKGGSEHRVRSGSRGSNVKGSLVEDTMVNGSVGGLGIGGLNDATHTISSRGRTVVSSVVVVMAYRRIVPSPPTTVMVRVIVVVGVAIIVVVGVVVVVVVVVIDDGLALIFIHTFDVVPSVAIEEGLVHGGLIHVGKPLEVGLDPGRQRRRGRHEARRQGGGAGVERRGSSVEGIGELRVEVGRVQHGLELRLERWHHVLAHQGVPVDVIEEAMALEFLGVVRRSQPMTRVAIEEAFDEVAALGAEGVTGEADLAEGDVLVHLLRLLGVEGTPTATHLEDQDAERPKIHHLGVAVLVQEDLGGQVLGRAAEGVGRVVLGQVRLGETEVAEGDMAVGIQQDILRFEISIDDVVLMQVLQRQDQLGDVEFGPMLVEVTVLLEVPEELPTRHEVRNEVEVGGGLEGELQAHDEGRVRGGRAHEDVAFAHGMGHLFLLHDDLLGQHLHGVDALRVLFPNLIHLSEGA